jgi:hypothetical protein
VQAAYRNTSYTVTMVATNTYGQVSEPATITVTEIVAPAPTLVLALGSVTLGTTTATKTLSSHFGAVVGTTPLVYSMAANPQNNASISGGVLSVVGNNRNTSYAVTVRATNAFLKTVDSSLAVTETGLAIPADGLAAWFDGDSYNASTRKWVNKTGDATHDATNNNSAPTVVTTVNGWKHLSGITTAGFIFKTGTLTTTYTLFHVAKYNNTTQRGRIFDGASGPTPMNWLSGFHGNKAGCAHHLGWITDASTDIHGTNWVMSSDTNNPPMYRSNGTNRTLANATSKLTSAATMFISMNEQSAWSVGEIIVYTRTLTLAEIQSVESYLRSKYTGVNI